MNDVPGNQLLFIFFSFSLFPVSRKKKNGTVKNARIKINLIEKIKNKWSGLELDLTGQSGMFDCSFVFGRQVRNQNET